MSISELYGYNEDFRDYVDRYKERENIPTSEALTHYMVREYAAYLLAQPKKLNK